jgi:hypothetical protein
VAQQQSGLSWWAKLALVIIVILIIVIIVLRVV